MAEGAEPAYAASRGLGRPDLRDFPCSLGRSETWGPGGALASARPERPAPSAFRSGTLASGMSSSQ